MDRRNFFKVCAGAIAGVVLLPLKVLQGKEVKTLKAELMPCVDCDGEAAGYILHISCADDCTIKSGEYRGYLESIGTPTHTLVGDNGGLVVPEPYSQAIFDEEHCQVSVGWAKDIRDKSARRYLRQRHKI